MKNMKIENIPINDIVISKFNVRKSISEEELDNLANSIKENELLQPIIVTLRNDNKYELIAGQRRYFACKDKLHWTEIPARVLPDADDLKIVTLSTIENLQRVNLSQVEKMEAFSTIYKMYEENAKMVAKTTGYTTQTVQVYLDLQEKLNEDIKQEIAESKIVVGTKTLVALTKNVNIPREEQSEVLKELLGVKNQEAQIKIINTINDEKTRVEVVDRLKGSDIIQKLALKVLLFRSNNIKDEALNAFRVDLVMIEKEFFKRLQKLERVSPLYNILLDLPKVDQIFGNLKYLIIGDPSKVELLYKDKIQYHKYEPEKLLESIIMDFERNHDKYTSEIKIEISEFLKRIPADGIFLTGVKKFLKLLETS